MDNTTAEWVVGLLHYFLRFCVPFLTLFSPFILKELLQSKTKLANWYWDDPHENARRMAFALAALRVGLIVLVFTIYHFSQNPGVFLGFVFGLPLEYALTVPLSDHYPALTWLGVLGCCLFVFGFLFVFWFWWLRTFYQEDGHLGHKEQYRRTLR